MVAVTHSSKNPWKVLPEAELGQVENWQPPDLAGTDFSGFVKRPAPVQPPPPTIEEADEPLPALPTLEEIEQIQRQAREEGYEQGRSEGYEAGQKEAMEEARPRIAEKLAHLERLLSALDAPFKTLDEQVEQELLALVVAMVRQLVRREVRTDPHQIIGVIREAVSILPVNSREIRVLLHPEDAEIVRELYALSHTEQSWKLLEDPVVERGGCRVLTDVSQIDATLEARLHNVIAPLLGSVRGEDSAEHTA